MNKSKGSSSQAANAGDVIAYPTLEGLFGEMDYCACDHCRSILSPAAYWWICCCSSIVPTTRGLPTWIAGRTIMETRHIRSSTCRLERCRSTGRHRDHPLEVLLERRPDIQHLPLTCENTNTPLPYIDLVNETLEYFVSQ